jgi:type VI secretion system protein VasD
MRIAGTSRLPYGARILLERRVVARSILVVGALLVAACAAPPPKPVVTPVSITLSAAADANPDARGRPSPLAIRVYVLKSPGLFQSADFFSLFDKDTATLGAELIQREELLLAPGESKKLDFTLQPDAKVIGVMAAYRDLEHSKWREIRPLEIGKANVLAVKLGARQITIGPP